VQKGATFGVVFEYVPFFWMYCVYLLIASIVRTFCEVVRVVWANAGMAKTIIVYNRGEMLNSVISV
jgi:hypothetical protein